MNPRGLLFFVLAVVAAIAAMFMLMSRVTSAHELGCDGKPPTAEIKHSCCGDHDWLRLEPGMWKQDGKVYFVMLDGKWEPVVDGHDNHPIEPMPSTDGCDYVWFRRQSEDGYWHDDESAHTGTGDIHFFCLQLNMSF